MGKGSQIQWTDITWNVARGCRKVDSDCKFCYMYRDSFNGHRYNPREVVRTKTVFNLPLKIKQTKSDVWDGPPLIFTSSLTDWALEEIDSYRHEIWDIIRKRPDLVFQLLTKRPERIQSILPPDWGDGWDNVWLGTSVGSNGAKTRLYDLAKVKCKTRFVSFEPLHEEITDIEPELAAKFDWVIIGGESGHDTGKYRYRTCKIEWINSLIGVFREAGAAIFVKQVGTYLAKELKMEDRHGGVIEEFPKELQIREFPIKVKYGKKKRNKKIAA